MNAPISVITALLMLASGGSAAVPDPEPEPVARRRAAYGMVLHLRDVARATVHLGADSMASGGCPRSLQNVVFGMAKTDPWGSPFRLRCQPGPAASPEIDSAGPDRTFDTHDDLSSDRPFADAKAACEVACTRARLCSNWSACVAETAEARCAVACKGSDIAFFAETCSRLDRCADMQACLQTALRGQIPDASCQDFGRAAARNRRLAKKLAAECDRDVLRVHELLCVQATKDPTTLPLCFLTVNRLRVEELLRSRRARK